VSGHPQPGHRLAVAPDAGAGVRGIPACAIRWKGIDGRAGTSASVLQYTSYGESWYRGVTVSLNQRFSGRHQLLVSYTVSKAEDTSTDFQSAFLPEANGVGRNPAKPTGLPLGFDPSGERGPSTHDQRHRLVVSGFYNLPLGIRAAAIATAASGRPFTPLAGVDLNGDGDGDLRWGSRQLVVASAAGTGLFGQSENSPEKTREPWSADTTHQPANDASRLTSVALSLVSRVL
jgi:hypothetical protein